LEGPEVSIPEAGEIRWADSPARILHLDGRCDRPARSKVTNRKITPTSEVIKGSRQALLLAQLGLLVARARLGLPLRLNSVLRLAFLVHEIEPEDE
jgi:hypothetical protein